jgi:uncharacterized protein YwgA
MIDNRLFLNDVLFVLYSGDSLSWNDLNRTNFQKILYLSAALAPLVKIDWEYEFTNAPYGPFNREIYKASDLLKHYGYADVTELLIQKDSKMRISYKITERGRAEVDSIRRLKKERERLHWIGTVMKVLDIYGPTVITKLAYKEPTFSKMRRENKGGVINLSPDGNRSIRLLRLIADEMNKEFSIELDTLTSNLIAYFDFLSRDIGQGAQK